MCDAVLFPIEILIPEYTEKTTKRQLLGEKQSYVILVSIPSSPGPTPNAEMMLAIIFSLTGNPNYTIP